VGGSKVKGYNGKVLRVNLTNGKCSIEEPSEDYYKRYVGGRGFIIHTLLTELQRGIDPLGPDNKLIFALGPMTGHPLMGSAKSSVGSKSPLSDGFGESEAGGFWGAELKRSGYDAIIVEGASPTPVFLWIENGDPEIRDARDLWGLEVAETERSVQQEIGDKKIRTAAIGPAGEKLVRYACIAYDISSIAGRTGMGAVMGSKKLKAIAVKGKTPPEMADEEKISELSRWMVRNFKEKAPYWRYGTGSNMVGYEASGNLPIRNFSGGPFPGVKEIAPQVMFEKSYIERMHGCFRCPMRCKRRVKIENPWKIDPIYSGPEYETLAAFGSNCGIDNLEAIIKANELCNRFGLDTISTGVSISFAMECFEKGLLTMEDTEGLELTFGSAESMVEMVERIAFREGLGDLLAEGTKRAAEKIGKGSAEFAMHVKGEEIPMHEPRYKQGLGLHYGVHATGADHCTGIHDDVVSKNLTGWDSIDLAQSMPSTELSPRKARMLYHVGLWRHLANHLGLCIFVPWSYRQISDAMEAVTGWPMSYWRLMKAAERGITLARIFNIREGFSAEDDRLPQRFSASPQDGPLKGILVDPEKFAEVQKIYYQMLGWDERGIPTYARLAELDIEWASEYLPW
jgi:aldehyde:ferredoxin oxidoreductase